MEKTFESQLEELLENDPVSIFNQNRCKFDELAGPFANAIVLAGAGEVGQKALAGLRRLGIEPLAFADNNSDLWGKAINGLDVLSPQEAAQKFCDRAVFVVTVYNGSGVGKQLRNLNCARVAPFAYLFWKYPEILLPHASLDKPHQIYMEADDVRKSLSLWADEVSRREYLAQLRWRLFLDSDSLPPPLPMGQIYFPLDLISLSSEEVFVDCGAFDGDSVRNFIQRQRSTFRQIIAIEADPTNYKKLQHSISALPGDIQNRVVVRQLAIGKQAGKIRFDARGTAGSSIATSGGVEVECAPLDDILKGYLPTYIKMDIEGAEVDALMGAQNLIKKASAVWAICLYHQQDHLWRVPHFMHSLSNRFSFFLRRYAEEGWELLCYAVPIERLAT